MVSVLFVMRGRPSGSKLFQIVLMIFVFSPLFYQYRQLPLFSPGKNSESSNQANLILLIVLGSSERCSN